MYSEQEDIKNQFDRKDNFMFAEQIIDGNPETQYLILCANINHDDTWVWKFCSHEDNFTPVWSEEYGDCKVTGANLHKVMEQANDWINATKHPKKRIHPDLFLMKLA
jgi:hypothetical protein